MSVLQRSTPQHNGRGRRFGESNDGPGQQPRYPRRPLLRRKRHHRRRNRRSRCGLVYICALAPDADETSQTQQAKFRRPTSSPTSKSWMTYLAASEGTKYFCGDLRSRSRSSFGRPRASPNPTCSRRKPGNRLEVEAELVHRRQTRPHRQPDLERFFAKRMGATTYELESSHSMLSQPDRVLDVIRAAAKAVQESTAVKQRG